MTNRQAALVRLAYQSAHCDHDGRCNCMAVIRTALRLVLAMAVGEEGDAVAYVRVGDASAEPEVAIAFGGAR